MDVTLKRVAVNEKEILRNLLEKYNYEFSQYDLRDVNALGLYGYDYLDCYWTEDNRWAYFIYAGDKLAGFAMVNDYQEADDREMDFSMAEFFVLYKYRRMGIGQKAVFKVFDRHKGRWQLRRHPQNVPSVHFWNKVIDVYTNGQYELVEAYPRSAYDDGTLADMFFFES